MWFTQIKLLFVNTCEQKETFFLLDVLRFIPNLTQFSDTSELSGVLNFKTRSAFCSVNYSKKYPWITDQLWDRNKTSRLSFRPVEYFVFDVEMISHQVETSKACLIRNAVAFRPNKYQSTYKRVFFTHVSVCIFGHHLEYSLWILE